MARADIYEQVLKLVEAPGLVLGGSCLTLDNLKGQNLGFPLLPHFRR